MKLTAQNTFLIDHLRNNQLIVAIGLNQINTNDIAEMLIEELQEPDNSMKKSVLLDISNSDYNNVTLKSECTNYITHNPYAIDKIAIVTNKKQRKHIISFLDYFRSSHIQMQFFDSNTNAFLWL